MGRSLLYAVCVRVRVYVGDGERGSLGSGGVDRFRWMRVREWSVLYCATCTETIRRTRISNSTPYGDSRAGTRQDN